MNRTTKQMPVLVLWCGLMMLGGACHEPTEKAHTAEAVEASSQGGEAQPSAEDEIEQQTEATTCAELAAYTGQIGNINPDRAGGGTFVAGEAGYAADSGLFRVKSAVEQALGQGRLMEDDEELVLPDGEEIVITGATVTSTAFDRSDESGFTVSTLLTVQDQRVGVSVYTDGITRDKNGEFITVKVGDVLNFKVKRMLADSQASYQISLITDVEKVAEGQPVGVLEKTGSTFGPEDYQKLARVHGIIDGASRTCGGSSVCFVISHGGSRSVTLRIDGGREDLPRDGDCVTFIGPVGAFPGPLTTGRITYQLDAVNPLWFGGLR